MNKDLTMLIVLTVCLILVITLICLFPELDKETVWELFEKGWR